MADGFAGMLVLSGGFYKKKRPGLRRHDSRASRTNHRDNAEWRVIKPFRLPGLWTTLRERPGNGRFNGRFLDVGPAGRRGSFAPDASAGGTLSLSRRFVAPVQRLWAQNISCPALNRTRPDRLQLLYAQESLKT